MDIKQIVENLGGQVAVREITGLSKGRISQWVTQNNMPRSWVLYLKEKRPDAFPPDELIQAEISEVDSYPDPGADLSSAPAPALSKQELDAIYAAQRARNGGVRDLTIDTRNLRE